MGHMNEMSQRKKAQINRISFCSIVAMETVAKSARFLQWFCTRSNLRTDVFFSKELLFSEYQQ